jgi:ribonuclease HI
VHRSSI